ncbi:MAG: ScyD/ScyE family protein, partial [Thermomicrobiales bacterium]
MTRLMNRTISRRTGMKAAGVLMVAPLAQSPLAALAQDASPEAVAEPTANGEISIVAEGLANPRGFTWDDSGALWVALAGSGGADPSTGTPVAGPAGPRFGGETAAIVQVVDGQVETVVGELPSAIDNFGQVYGVADLAILDGQLYALFQGAGPSNGSPDSANGLYRVTEEGAVELVADLGTWRQEIEIAQPAEGIEPDGSWYALTAGDGVLWATEAHESQLATVSPDGTVSRVVDASVEDPTFTDLALAPDGGVYAAGLGRFPYIDGSTKVLHIAPDGTMTDFWTGLTAVTSIAIGPDGLLYAAEMTTNNSQETVMLPGSGRVVRMTGPDGVEPVVTGLTLPVHIGFGPDGALYVASPAVGADAGAGAILRVALAGVAPAA